MRNLILQFFSVEPDLNPSKKGLYESAIKTVERYAKNIGWDYKLETQKYFKGYSPVWEVFRILESHNYDHYDKIVFIDADVFIVDTSENVFEKYNEFAACREVDDPTPKSRPEYVKWKNEYFNSGIIVFPRDAINQLRLLDPKSYREKYRDLKPGRDQYALNLMVEKIFGTYTRIDRKDACFLRETKYSKTTPVVHLAGRCRQLYHANPEFYHTHFGVNK